MDSTIVIKVNYGRTLRRFNARVDEAGKLELSLDGLREKVLSLFSLSSEIDLALTYFDEDGDSVTIADDDDLTDIMMQSLNPLRITAKENSKKANDNSVNAASSGTSTPMRPSPTVSQALPDLNKTISEIFKNVPEPMGEALSKLSHDLASKTIASSPQLPELVHSFSKMLQSCMVPDSDAQASNAPEVVPVNISINQPLRDHKKADPILNSSGVNTLLSPEPSPKPVKKAIHLGSVNTLLNPEPSPKPVKKAIHLGKKHVKEPVNQPRFVNPSAGYEKMKDPIFTIPVENTFVSPGLGDDKEQVKKSAASVIHDAFKAASKDFKAYPYPLKSTDYPGRRCPTSGMPKYSNFPSNPFSPPSRRNSHGCTGSVFHTGVCCDGCGVHPITGPRYKSKVKEDYDLCSMCYSEMGSEAEYIRIDLPVPYRHYPLKGQPIFPPRVPRPWGVPPSTLPLNLHNNVVKDKLDSRFIMDVNVSDGSTMAPLTPFTKIWRMRNDGNLVWPHGTKLVWIGGDRLSSSVSAEIQIPVTGLPAEDEIEVAVDFIAPEQPGRYISYWRLASPSSQKFGQRVWVLIQVDASTSHSTNISTQGLNLNFPPQNETENVAVNGRLPIVEPSYTSFENLAVDGHVPIPEPSNNANYLVEPLVVSSPTKDQNVDFPINDNLLVSSSKTVSYPIVDSSSVPPVMTDLAPPTPPVEVEKWEEASGEEDDGVEEILLRELAQMGFEQVDLNKEILRMNEYNLEKSVDDLCGVSEWDPILEELQEMGFADSEMNRKLLKKNNGSIKHVVMELVNGEKA